MDEAEMLALAKNILGITNNTEDTVLLAYLRAAGKEILQWRYGATGNVPDTVPAEYELTQVFAVVSGYTQRGAEGQTWFAENGVMRTFHYDDMIQYIRRNVVQLVGVPR